MASKQVSAWREADFLATPVEITGSADAPFRIAPADVAVLDGLSDAECQMALQYLYSAWQHEMARRRSGTIIATPAARHYLARQADLHWVEQLAAAYAEYERASQKVAA